MFAKNDVKSYIFTDKTKSESCQILASNVADPQYGMYVWPCAPVLGQYIWYNRDKVKGKNILELGAGCALPGIVAVKCGGSVRLSDSKNLPDARQNSKRSCELNGISDIPVLGITWGKFHSDLLNLGKVDVILGSDCYYNTKDFEDILVTVAFILENNPNAEFWTTYQVRR